MDLSDSASSEFLQRDLSFIAVELNPEVLVELLPLVSRGGEPEVVGYEKFGRDEKDGIGQEGTPGPPLEPLEFESSS